MPTSKQSNRRPRGKRSPAITEQLASFQRSLAQALKNNRRQQQLRRQRQQRQHANPATEQQLVALRRALQFRWLQRRWQRRQRSAEINWKPTAWLRPHTGEGISTREAAALLMRLAAAAMLVLILISLALNAVPLQLLAPSWYLQVLAYIAENVPVLMMISVLALLSLVISNDDEGSSKYRARLLQLSRTGYVMAVVLLPLQLGFTGWLFGDAYSTSRTQLAAIRSGSEALIAGAQQTTSTEQFVAYLRSRNLTGNLESIAAAPLVQVKTEFIRSVKNQQQQQEERLGAAIRSTLLRYGTNATKLFATLVILAIFLRGFQTLLRRCWLQSATINMEMQETPGHATGLANQD